MLICICTMLLPDDDDDNDDGDDDDDDDLSSNVAFLDGDGSIVIIADVLEGLPMEDIDEVVPIKYTHGDEYF